MNNNEIQKQRYLEDFKNFKDGDILEFEYRDYLYYVKHVGGPIGYLCGYVDLNSTSKLDEGLIDQFDVHGGVTFHGRGKHVGLNYYSMYLGFDCMHYGDWKLINSNLLSKSSYGIYRDVNFVKQECKKLIDQYINYKESIDV